MTTIRRLADSCLVLRTDTAATLIDPGFFTFDSGVVDLNTVGDISRVLITHEHGDHVKPEFVRWLIDRGTDVTVHGNLSVADLLAPHDIEVLDYNPKDVTSEDVLHGKIPSGDQPPNRAYTVDGILTHPGDSTEPTKAGPVMALGLLIPWATPYEQIQFAKRVGVRQVIPTHDFYLTDGGREFIEGFAGAALAAEGIEMISLLPGASYTV
ncbi:MAG TPA: MBL fold metallo-hydrolase [Actinobacteria bacterium]|nr:MBL fold metallo-hydrolase [Actinomycetota bacterium]